MEWLVNVMVEADDADAVHDLVAGWTLSPGAVITMINSAQPISVIAEHHEVDAQGNVGEMKRRTRQPSVRRPEPPPDGPPVNGNGGGGTLSV